MSSSSTSWMVFALAKWVTQELLNFISSQGDTLARADHLGVVFINKYVKDTPHFHLAITIRPNWAVARGKWRSYQTLRSLLLQFHLVASLWEQCRAGGLASTGGVWICALVVYNKIEMFTNHRQCIVLFFCGVTWRVLILRWYSRVAGKSLG